MTFIRLTLVLLTIIIIQSLAVLAILAVLTTRHSIRAIIVALLLLLLLVTLEVSGLVLARIPAMRLRQTARLAHWAQLPLWKRVAYAVLSATIGTLAGFTVMWLRTGTVDWWLVAGAALGIVLAAFTTQLVVFPALARWR